MILRNCFARLLVVGLMLLSTLAVGAPAYAQIEEIEVDDFPSSAATVRIGLPDGSEMTVALVGPTRVEVVIGAAGESDDSNGNGLDDVATEIVQMELTGVSPMGPVIVRLNPSPLMPSLGEIEETVNTQAGRLDVPPFAPSGTANSFFDVFIEIEIGVAGLVLHNGTPVRMSAVITHKPPGPGTTYESAPGPIPLLDPNGNPTGVTLISETHTPVPDGEGNGPGPKVGGDVYPVNKAAILAPWIALAVAIITGAAITVRRRHSQS